MVDPEILAWNTAIAIIDRSELHVRDLIERRLLRFGGLRGTLPAAQKATDELMADITRVRTRAIKSAFRKLRDGLNANEIPDAEISAEK